ncbi:hypothetical protein SYNPS1DRAFT_26692 [Syncephalis pseudoplumigaleata]|uniref:RRM domain-containing protein n=1 Tax=Syncephalis pseudoplumigaleata TaxID=1712513 RepID=A0A4P9Z4Y6_9FUNG|nr:hypothetical protein SYNPS1DRAFT_26692 [Syncephalis pseudoplumigaleata]|eukprot:RKP27664.1 hypothetical protein SYNPS1DRAFT_26692 [Syncephalis pseudoplumigaleata]
MNMRLHRALTKALPLTSRAGQVATLTTNNRRAPGVGYSRNSESGSRTQLTAHMRQFRFELARPLRTVEEVESVADYFRQYGRLTMYRMSRCFETHLPHNHGYIAFDKDADIERLIQSTRHKIEKLNMDVQLSNPDANRKHSSIPIPLSIAAKQQQQQRLQAS